MSSSQVETSPLLPRLRPQVYLVSVLEHQRASRFATPLQSIHLDADTTGFRLPFAVPKDGS